MVGGSPYQRPVEINFLILYFKTITIGRSSSTMLLLSKSQILIPEAVAAQSQYLFGLKVNALMVSPASSEYKCFPSLRSQSMVIPSFPPEAQRDPSGEIVMLLMYPVCPI